MTYTTVSKVYPADTFAAAVAEMMLDPDIWKVTGPVVHERDTGSVLAVTAQGEAENTGYCVESWEWSDHELTVHFR